MLEEMQRKLTQVYVDSMARTDLAKSCDGENTISIDLGLYLSKSTGNFKQVFENSNGQFQRCVSK